MLWLTKVFLIFIFRLSKEHDSNSVALGTSDWLELVQEIDNIQKQTGEYLILEGWVYQQEVKAVYSGTWLSQ